MESSISASDEQQRLFFETLYGECISADSRLAVTFLKSEARKLVFNETEFAQSLPDAITIIANAPLGKEVYFAVGLMGKTTEPHSRGTERDVVVLPALFADIDIKGPGHNSHLPYPPTMEEARALIDEFPLRPSIVNETGGGFHCFWVLAEPWHVADAEERERAKTLSRGWNKRLIEVAKQRGLGLDAVGELCRLARVPGTNNHKLAAPRPVRFGGDTGERFTPDQIAKLIAQHQPSSKPRPQAMSTPLLAAPAASPESRQLDVERWLDRVGAEILERGTTSDGSKVWRITCPRIDAHSTANGRRDCSIQQETNGRMGAKCFHNSCGIADWHSLCVAMGKPTPEEWGHSTPNVALDRFLANKAAEISIALSPTSRAVIDVVEHDEDEPFEDEDLRETLTFPEQCLQPEGLLGDTIRYILDVSRYPQPELALAASVAMMATYAGRKVRDEEDTRTNIYIVGLDLSGSGKDQARKCIKKLMGRNAANLLGCERIGSGAGIVTAVEQNPSHLMLLDEMGRMLEVCKTGAKNPAMHHAISILMQIFSSADSNFTSDAYADASRVKSIQQPCLCIYGTSTPDKFFDSLTSDNVGDGFLGRLLAFQGRGYVDPKRPEKRDPPEELLKALEWWADWQPSDNPAAIITPQPRILMHTPEARQRFEGHAEEIAKRRRGESANRAAIWSRTAEKTAKLALIHACSRSITDPKTIELVDVEFGIKLANYLTRTLVQRVAEHVADSAFETDLKKVLRAIMSAGEQGLTATALQRKTQSLEPRRRHDVLATLAGTRRICQIERPTKGRTAIVYVAVAVASKKIVAAKP